MDAEAIVWLIFIAIWFISGVVRQIKQVASKRPGQQRPGQERPGQEGQQQARSTQERQERLPEDDPMVQLLRKLGGEVEVRPQEPPQERRPQPMRTRTPSPPPPAPPVRVQQSSASIDRSRPAKVARRPKIAQQAAIPEMKLPPIVPAVSTGGGPPVALARNLRRDLRRPDSLKKAVLLQEILGKPPGLQGLRR